jgi:hypothetical protein
LRELLARGVGNELSLTFFLAVWLAGSAIGAKLWVRIGRGNASLSAPLLIAGTATVVAGLVLARLLPVPGAVTGEVAGPGAVILLGICILFVPALLTAGLFPLAASAGPSPGRAYVIEAIGALVGGCATTALMIGRVTSTAILALAIAAVAGCLLRRGWILAILLLVAVVSGLAGRLDTILFASGWGQRHPGLMLRDHRATPTRSLALSEREGERWLFADEAPREALDDPYRDDAVAALLLAIGPDAERILLVDFGQATVAPALIGAGVSEVVCLLPEPEDTLLVPTAHGVEFRIGDPRRSLRDLPIGWDRIAVSGPEAVTVSSNRLWTSEMFALMASRLAARGVIVAIAPGGEAAVGPEAEGWRRSVASALREAVGTTRTIDADRYIFAASPDPSAASLDPDSLTRRFRRSGRVLRTYPPERFGVEYPTHRLRTLDSAPANRDAHPAAFTHALGRWIRRAGLPVDLPHLPAVAVGGLLVLLLLAPLLLAPRLERDADAVLIATGAASMGLDLLVLMTYQARVGILQGGLGALLGAFLGGTAIGGAISTAARPRSVSGYLVAICLTQVGLAVLATFMLPRLPFDPTVLSTTLFAIFACALGVTCGLPFPIVAKRTSTARAWAADSVGGILGALLFLVCIRWGLSVTGLVLAALPLIVTTRFLGSRARSWSSVHP